MIHPPPYAENEKNNQVRNIPTISTPTHAFPTALLRSGAAARRQTAASTTFSRCFCCYIRTMSPFLLGRSMYLSFTSFSL